MRHFSADANDGCVSPLFIHKEALHVVAGLPAPEKLSPLRRGAALRELSVSGRDEETGAQEQQQERHLFLQTGPV